MSTKRTCIAAAVPQWGGVRDFWCNLGMTLAQETIMQAEEPQRPDAGELDEDTLAFVRKVFQWARSGQTDELTTLLGQGLPPNLRNERGDSLLMLACYHGHVGTARALLEHGADPELQNDAGQSPLAGAAFKGDVAVATLLLAHGAQVDNAGPDGKTALMYAAMFNRTDIASLLLERGANPLAVDASGLSMVEAARRMGATDTAALLTALASAR
jgi:ankyrin repeat protein